VQKPVVKALKSLTCSNIHNFSLRTAAFIIACTRVLAARELRGLYP
jgi:glutamate dehydrogenase (NAD(P)+)